MSKFWSQDLDNLTPYVPGEAPLSEDIIKLNTNENPFGPSEKVLNAMKSTIDGNLRLYPDSSSLRLRKAIASYHGLSVENIFVGNGSDEVLSHVFRGLFRQKRPILFPDITYSFYPVYCNLHSIDFMKIPLSVDFKIDYRDYSEKNGGIIFPNPNAPTGIQMAQEDIERLLLINEDSAVIIDEAYVDFGGDSVIQLTKKHENLLVTRTFSKSHSLAGIRVGYAAGNPQLIEALSLVKNSFNSYPINAVSEAAAIAAIKDRQHIEFTRSRIVDNRDYLIRELGKLDFETLPSKANFVFTRRSGLSGEDIAVKLRKKGFLIRHFSCPRRLNPFVRITIGSKGQCLALINSLQQLFPIKMNQE